MTVPEYILSYLRGPGVQAWRIKRNQPREKGENEEFREEGRIFPPPQAPLKPAGHERKQTEEALRRSEKNLKRAEKIAKIGNWEWNILTNELVWSEEVYRIYGADPLKDKPSYDIVVKTVAPECRDRFVKAVEDAVRLDKHFEGEFRMIGLDGRERFTHTSGEVVRDRDNRPVSMFGIVQDITERKRAEEALQENEDKFRSIFEQATTGLDSRSCAEGTSRRTAICAMLGYTRDELCTQC
jgi:PAS domain S-box-containing protein